MTMKVMNYKKFFLTNYEDAKDKKQFPSSLRFTVNEQRAAVKADPKKKMSDYIDSSAVP